LTSLTSYTFTVKATNANGDSVVSASSNEITTDIGPLIMNYLVLAGGGGGGRAAVAAQVDCVLL
jgi:hypothetical protein